MNAQILKRTRKEKKVNLEELSRITKLSRQAISLIENGGDCKLSNLTAICHALDCKIIIVHNDQL